MDRISTKHGARVDDALSHKPRETDYDTPAGAPEPGSPPGMTYDEVEARSNLGRFIPMASLPGDRAALISGARDLNAPDEVIRTLERLPEGETYETVNQVWAALGGNNEAQRT
ncbi:hypothetical protein Val02_44280 [Virgisporangium aliadipatigenens]|uniref:DUF2795 domain-containing protein n=1 Tax=Virgisporangium aliadipatigenens TaxID=741659 RepID=A0A8J3YNE2_9ACTN|nr:DUF2795 domain-containing protein [Virgisporangium aliadipatigenens]GIJ47542.1 hypothetical protein Val02_44280 [Virgisporangium aliadipatigenens]